MVCYTSATMKNQRQHTTLPITSLLPTPATDAPTPTTNDPDDSDGDSSSSSSHHSDNGDVNDCDNGDSNGDDSNNNNDNNANKSKQKQSNKKQKKKSKQTTTNTIAEPELFKIAPPGFDYTPLLNEPTTPYQNTSADTEARKRNIASGNVRLKTIKYIPQGNTNALRNVNAYLRWRAEIVKQITLTVQAGETDMHGLPCRDGA